MPAKFVTNTTLSIIAFALVVVVLCHVFFGLEALCSALITVNLVAFQLCYVDKKAAARGGLRVPEYSLQILALLGGGPALIVSMILFRHKTKKKAFIIPLCVIIVLQLALFCLFA